MPFIPIVDTARVTINYQLHGQKCTNNFYVQRAGGWTDQELNNLANLVLAWVDSDLKANLSTNCDIRSVKAVDMSAPDQEGVEIAPPVPIAGTILAQGAPGNVTLAIKFVTGFTGRAKRGRIYQVGLSEDDTEGNQADSVRVTGLVDAWLALRGDIIAADYTMVVASLYDGFDLVGPDDDGVIKKVPKPRSTGLVTPVTHILAEANLDSQRRRLHGRGQ